MQSSPASLEEPWYAIDYGTSNSLIALVDKQGVHPPIELKGSRQDQAIMRSVLYTESGDKWQFGEQAVERYGENGREGRIFRSLKKFLPDPSFEGTKVFQKNYSIVDLVALFLRYLKEKADKSSGLEVRNVVFGRPAVFHPDPQRDQLAQDRLQAAARMVGFDKIEFCPEPLAAAYEFRKQLNKPQKVLIADFGGGTSDFTVLSMSRDRFSKGDVLAIGGVSRAGDAFDGVIMRHFVSPYFGAHLSYKMPTGSNELKLPRYLLNKMCSAADISFLGRKDIMRLLKDAARWSLKEEDQDNMDRLFVLVEENQGYNLFSAIERTKIDLSTQDEALLSFHYPGIDLEKRVPTLEFSLQSQPTVSEICASLDATLEAAQCQPSDIDIVCCTGGTARVKPLQVELEKRFGSEKLTQYKNFQSVILGLGQYILEKYEPS